MNSDWVDGERAAALARIGGMGPGVSPEAESLRSGPRDSEDRAGERGWGPRVLPRGRESTLEAEGQRRPCRRAGVGPRVLPRGRESTLGAEGQRRPCRRAGVGPQSLTPRPRVYARGRGTAKTVPASGGGAQSLTPRPRVYARGRGTAKTVPASGGGAPESYPAAESLRSRPRDSEDRAGERGWGPRVLPRGRESTLEAEGQRRPCRGAGGGARRAVKRRTRWREMMGQAREACCWRFCSAP